MACSFTEVRGLRGSRLVNHEGQHPTLSLSAENCKVQSDPGCRDYSWVHLLHGRRATLGTVPYPLGTNQLARTGFCLASPTSPNGRKEDCEEAAMDVQLNQCCDDSHELGMYSTSTGAVLRGVPRVALGLRDAVPKGLQHFLRQD